MATLIHNVAQALFALWLTLMITTTVVMLTDIRRKLDTMADTIQDEAAALTVEETTVAALVKDVAGEITKFQQAQAAGADTAPFVTRINAINTSLQAVDQSALAAAGTVPVALPPATPAPAAGS